MSGFRITKNVSEVQIMSQLLRVEWKSGSRFYSLIERVTSKAARRWRGEPAEALGYIWLQLKGRFAEGDLIDLRQNPMDTIIKRKVTNFHQRAEKPLGGKGGRLSLGEAEEFIQRVQSTAQFQRTGRPQARSPISFITAFDEIAHREVMEGLQAALAELSSRQRAAVLACFKLDECSTAEDLARLWKTTPQNVRWHSQRGVNSLRMALKRFASQA